MYRFSIFLYIFKKLNLRITRESVNHRDPALTIQDIPSTTPTRIGFI